MNFCPRCGLTLTSREDGGRERQSCPDVEGCGFIHFGDFSIGVGAVVFSGDKALLVQRGQNPNRGAWQIPGGYAEADEDIALSIEREVLEEAGVTAKIRDAIGFRHAIGGGIGGPSTNIYIVFRLDAEPGETSFDNDEIIGAGYFSLDEMANMERVQSLSSWAIDLAMRTPRDAGLGVAMEGPGADRPGWTMFGLRPEDTL